MKKPPAPPKPNADPAEPARPTADAGPDRRWVRALILLAGIVIPQCVLYGPSLTGRKLLLPLDLLGNQLYYLPGDVKVDPPPPSDWALGDLVLQEEVLRRFAVEQVRSGRLPLWNPYIYCGAPFVAANHTAVFSPYRVPDYFWPGPRVLAWDQMLRALVAGVGAYLLFRRELGAAFAAAVIGAWCFPLTGTLVLTVNWGHGATVTWLPWMFLAIGRAVRVPGAVSAAGVMLTTALLQVSGHAATGAQLLLAGAAFAAWKLFRHRRQGGRGYSVLARPAGTLVAGWVLGVMLAAPQILPTAEYMRGSERMAARLEGRAETAPMGPSALIQFLFPDFHGSSERGSAYLIPGGNRVESAAAGYPGLLLALVGAPLAVVGAWGGRRRGETLFWVGLAVVSMVPILGVPGLSRLFEVPPLGVLRNNRLVTVAGFAVLTLGVMGLDALMQPGSLRDVAQRRASRLMLIVAVALGGCLAYMATQPPPSLESAMEDRPQDLPAVRGWFMRSYAIGAGFCGVAVVAWAVIDSRKRAGSPAPVVWAVGLFALGEMVVTAWGDNPQSDPSLYYPPVPALEHIARSGPGRLWGVYSLPPNLAMSRRLPDVRGYDATDPARPVQLVELLSDRRYPPSPSFARTMWCVPQPGLPLLDALCVRYFVGRGNPPDGFRPEYRSTDYWVAENAGALPRVYVPRRAEVVNDAADRLARLGRADFHPSEVVYVESEQAVATGPYDADARIVSEEPNHVRVEVDARTPAIVVLADHWYAGWSATVNGRETLILRANHALRAVEVPAGKAVLEFRYAPGSFRAGLWLAATATVVQGCWLLVSMRGRRRGGINAVASF